MEFLNPLNGYPTYSANYTGTAGSTTAWEPGPQGVVVWSTTNAYIRVGEGVTATTSDIALPAGVPVAFLVPTGTGAPWRVSAIQVAAAGTVYAKPINSV
jgi:hypothetical protein